MVTLGGILIVICFVAGVYLGLTFSRTKVLTDSSGNYDTKKQTKLALVTALLAIGLIIGGILFFSDGHMQFS